MKYLVAVALIAAACGSSRPAVPGDAAVADNGSPYDAATDAPLDGAPADASIDAPPDAMPDAGCPPAGTEQLVSSGTPPLTYGMNIVGNGTTSLAVWGAGGNSVWALYDGGGLVASGETAWIDNSRLYSVGSRVVAFAGDAINVFDAGTWTRYAFPAISVATSGSSFIGIYPVGLHGAEARIFNGATVLGPTMITPHDAELVAGDGQGGFAVVTADTSNSSGVQHALMTFDGVSWSSEATIGAFESSTSSARAMELLPYNGSWALVFVLDDELNVMIDAGGTWTRTQTPLQVASTGSSQYVIAANGSTIAVLDNRGLAAVYKNGTWTQHVLTSTTTNEYRPTLRAYGGGFVAVYGGQVGLRAAVYDGTNWGSEVVLAAESASASYKVAASPDSAVVGFVEHTTSGNIPQARTFHNGSWEPAVVVGSNQSITRAAPALAVEADGIRTAYIEPGTAETMIEASGSWSTPEQLPSPPITGEVMGAAIAHAANGHTLLVWRQVVAEEIGVFAAENDGASWGPPVLLATDFDHEPRVEAAALASTFIVGWGGSIINNTAGRIARWTGTGIGPVMTVPGAPTLASDGSTFVATWTDQYSLSHPVYWVSSTNGDTWSGIASPGGSPALLTGGPAGVLALTVDSAEHIQAQLWHGGSWSASGAVPSWWSQCHAAVGTTSALAVCAGTMSQTSIALAEYSGGAWTLTTVSQPVVANNWSMLATDGTDYRFDIGSTVTASTVLHGGAWSTIVDDPGIAVPDVVTAACGHWTGVAGSSVVTATGDAPYTDDHATGLPPSARVSAGPQRLDAFWVAPTPTSLGQAVLHTRLGL